MSENSRDFCRPIDGRSSRNVWIPLNAVVCLRPRPSDHSRLINTGAEYKCSSSRHGDIWEDHVSTCQRVLRDAGGTCINVRCLVWLIDPRSLSFALVVILSSCRGVSKNLSNFGQVFFFISQDDVWSRNTFLPHVSYSCRHVPGPICLHPTHQRVRRSVHETHLWFHWHK